MSAVSHKHRPFIANLIEGTGKNQLKPDQECMEDVLVLSHYSLLKIPWPKPTGVLEHCREGEVKSRFSIFRVSHSVRIPKATKDVNVYLFIHSSNLGKLYQRIYVHYASEFRELFEATE
jgi:hypothetical protein